MQFYQQPEKNQSKIIVEVKVWVKSKEIHLEQEKKDLIPKVEKIWRVKNLRAKVTKLRAKTA